MISVNVAFFIQAVNFLLLMFLLNIFLYRPIRKVLADREAEISGSAARVAQVEKDVEEKMTQYETRLRDVRSKAGEERAALKREAQAEEASILESAQSEAAESLNLMKNRVAKEAADARALLQEQTRSLSTEICEKVLGRSL